MGLNLGLKDAPILQNSSRYRDLGFVEVPHAKISTVLVSLLETSQLQTHHLWNVSGYEIQSQDLYIIYSHTYSLTAQI